MNKKKIFAPLIACLLTISFFVPFLVKGKIPIPADALPGVFYPWRDNSIGGYNPEKFPVKNPLVVDPILATYPWRFVAIENIKQKQLPLWNPYSFSGQPLLGNFQSAPFQIFNILFFVFPFKIAWGIQIILPLILTTLFMYLFLKSIKISTVGSVFASFVLPFTGFFVAWMSMGIMITAAMWFPLILLCLIKLSKKITIKYFLILTFAFSQAILSGHVQTAFLVYLASFLFIIYIFINSYKYKYLIFCILSLFFAILISAPQILPSIEFINLSARNIDQAYNLGRSWFLKPQNLVQVLAPDFFGNPSTYNYWGASNYAEFVSFIGLVPLSFVILSFKIKKRLREFYFFAGLALLSLTLALPNFLSKIPYVYEVPYISSTQPSRIIFLLIFSLVVLSAYGFDWFLKHKSIKLLLSPLILLCSLSILFIMIYFFKNELPEGAYTVASRNLILPILTAIFLLLIYTANVININKKIIIIALISLTLFELFRFTAKFTSFSELSWIFPKTQTTDFLSKQEKPFRIMTTNGLILHPNTQSIYSIESINGYDPLYIRSYAKLISVSENLDAKANLLSFNRIVTPNKYKSNIINLLNVKYILSFSSIEYDGLFKIFDEGKTKVYENKNVLPRFFFVKEIQKVQNSSEELEAILNHKFNGQNTAISSDISFKESSFLSKVIVNQYTDQFIEITTMSDKTAPLVISNVNYPGWMAKIDGEDTLINTVNYNMQSILVPKGTHNIVLKYLPKSFLYGVYIGFFGLIITLITSVYIWKKSK